MFMEILVIIPIELLVQFGLLGFKTKVQKIKILINIYEMINFEMFFSTLNLILLFSLFWNLVRKNCFALEQV